MYNTRWENVVANRNLFDLIEICTWNDYSESHYIGPIHGAQPMSQAWVNGMDHSGMSIMRVNLPLIASGLHYTAAWLNMTSYYATAYKTGSYPSVTSDKIYVWARTHPKNANSPDPVPKPTNYEMVYLHLYHIALQS